MGVETELLGLKNRYDGKEFRVVEREDGTIAVLAGDVVIADTNKVPVTASVSDQGVKILGPDGKPLARMATSQAHRNSGQKFAGIAWSDPSGRVVGTTKLLAPAPPL